MNPPQNRMPVPGDRRGGRRRDDLVEARALYAGHGYAAIPAYSSGPYVDHWYEKRF
jgi:hypothetical protein